MPLPYKNGAVACHLFVISSLSFSRTHMAPTPPATASTTAGHSFRRVKVAIVGSGLSGLTAAYLLAKENDRLRLEDSDVTFDIHLFEKVRRRNFAAPTNWT